MNISKPFVTRPVATTLISCGIALTGVATYFLLPVASMPTVDFPAIVVTGSYPGGAKRSRPALRARLSDTLAQSRVLPRWHLRARRAARASFSSSISIVTFVVRRVLETQRHGKESPADAIHRACMLRFRPIMMTTLAAMLGALPLAVMTGQGSEMRRPLGIAIVGGLFISQILTLYTTPIVYIYVDRFRLWMMRAVVRKH